MTVITRKTLILGGTGFIGSHLIKELIRRYNHHGDKIMATTTRDPQGFDFYNNTIDWIQIKFDTNHHQQIEELIAKYKPDIIVNCIVLGAVESYQNPDLADMINNKINASLVDVIEDQYENQRSPELFLISTSNVFDAIDDAPDEDKLPKANLPYGRSKLAGEQHLRNMIDNNGYIIRVTTVWGPKLLPFQSSNLLLDVINNKTPDTLKLFTNIYRTPTIAHQVASAIITYIFSTNRYPIVHITEGKVSTFYDHLSQLPDAIIDKFDTMDYKGDKIPETLGLTTKYPQISKNLNLKSYLTNIKQHLE